MTGFDGLACRLCENCPYRITVYTSRLDQGLTGKSELYFTRCAQRTTRYTSAVTCYLVVCRSTRMIGTTSATRAATVLVAAPIPATPRTVLLSSSTSTDRMNPYLGSGP